MTKIYVEYKETCIYSEESDFDGTEFSGSYYYEYDYKIIDAYVSKPNSIYYEEFNVDKIPNNIYVVVVRYNTGDTFGQSIGKGHIEKICTTPKEAYEIKSQIEEDKYSNDEGYLQWQGYFEDLESVEVVSLNIK